MSQPNGTPLYEQETTINLYPAQVSKSADVYTCIPDMMKRLRKYADDRPDCVRIIKDTGSEVFAELDRSCIKISPKRKLTDEQRRQASERLALAREAKT